VSLPALVAVALLAQTGAPSAPPPTGAPPAEAAALVTDKAIADAPAIKNKDDAMTAAVSIGGLLATGNARAAAGSASGAFDLRRGEHAMGASVLGNYSEGRQPGAPSSIATAENLQGRLRYEYYVTDRASFFGMVTGRYDRFQGLDFRLNLDPGFKYVVFKEDVHTIWLEAGYDFQMDLRRQSARVVLDANKAPVLDAAGNPTLLDKTFADHSARLFAGYKIAFNKEVNGALGVEFLQGFRDADTGGKRTRVNVEALVAAKLIGSFSLGLGFTARYDSHPLPGKEQLDTSSQATLIYSFSEAPPKPAE